MKPDLQWETNNPRRWKDIQINATR